MRRKGYDEEEKCEANEECSIWWIINKDLHQAINEAGEEEEEKS